MNLKNLIKKSLISVSLIHLVSCEVISTSEIDTSFVNLMEVYESDQGSKKNEIIAKQTFLINEEIKEHINDTPSLKGNLSSDLEESRDFVAAAKTPLFKWVVKYEEKIEKLFEIIHTLGKENHQVDGNFKLISSQDNIIKNETLIVYSLLYLKKYNQTLLDILTPLTMSTLQNTWQGDKELEEFGVALQEKFFSMLGLSIVIQNDLKITLANLTKYRLKRQVPEYIEEALTDAITETLAVDMQRTGKINKAISKLPSKDLEHFKNIQKQYFQKLTSNTLLFDPLNSDSVAQKILVTIGNLTWGLPNTLIGVGIIFATMVVSPFSKNVDFPSFNMARSGQQIYVNVSGMGPMAGKMSMGLFEFDNWTYWSFASGHEAGHAKQSALLGPLYLPAVALSYAIYGFDKGFIETWATEWSVH